MARATLVGGFNSGVRSCSHLQGSRSGRSSGKAARGTNRGASRAAVLRDPIAQCLVQRLQVCPSPGL